MTETRPAWTDERLDDLSGQVKELGRRVDTGFSRVDENSRALRSDMRTEVGRLDTSMSTLRQEIRPDLTYLRSRMESRFTELFYTIVQVGAAIILLLILLGFGVLVAAKGM